MRTILFRADGNSTSGLGHLYRIFALMEMYQDKYNCLLLTKENSTTSVIPASCPFKAIPAKLAIDQEPVWLSENYPAENTWLIADGYQFTSDWQKKIKALNYKLAYIDDLCTEQMYADVVINHSLAVSAADYSIQPYTRLALGTAYAILRPLFIEAAKGKRNIQKTETVFVCFGGADALNLSLKAARALLNTAGIKNIHVVTGAAYHHTEIFELAKEQQQLHIYQNLSESNLIEVMKKCDVAIAPSSNILYEICAVKMPVLSGYYVENQKNIYKGSLQKGIIFDGGDFENYQENDFEHAIKALISEKKYNDYVSAQKSLFDGNNKTRFLDLLNNVSYRKALAEDMIMIFNWANDKLSRANSYFSEPILLETHKNWFGKKLQDSNCSIYIALVDHKPAGMVRYEVSGDFTVVGILVGEDFRGRGLASCFLKETSTLYFKENTKPVLAYIKKGNMASVISFEKAGYKKLKEEMVHGHPSFVYKLEKS